MEQTARLLIAAGALRPGGGGGAARKMALEVSPSGCFTRIDWFTQFKWLGTEIGTSSRGASAAAGPRRALGLLNPRQKGAGGTLQLFVARAGTSALTAAGARSPAVMGHQATSTERYVLDLSSARLHFHLRANSSGSWPGGNPV
eukprot:gene17139-biopygen13207